MRQYRIFKRADRNWEVSFYLHSDEEKTWRMYGSFASFKQAMRACVLSLTALGISKSRVVVVQ